MCSKKFFIRFLPFFATLIIGMFVASFFVPIGRPGFGGRRHHFEEDRQIRIELDRLKEENQRLKELNNMRMNAMEDSDFTLPVPPPPPAMPVRPAAPRATR